MLLGIVQSFAWVYWNGPTVPEGTISDHEKSGDTVNVWPEAKVVRSPENGPLN